MIMFLSRKASRIRQRQAENARSNRIEILQAPSGGVSAPGGIAPG